jgi:hypothetical protein
MRFRWLGGIAAIALLAAAGSASAVPCTSGGLSCTVTATLFTGSALPAGFDDFGIGPISNSKQAQGTPFTFGSQTITWSGGSPASSGLYAGSGTGFASPFSSGSQQAYLVAGGTDGSVTVTDAVGQGDTLSLIWGTVDPEAGRNLLFSITTGAGNITVDGTAVINACAGATPSVSTCIVTISGLGDWTAFTASDSSSAAFEFVPQTQAGVPEPASMAILGAALVGFGVLRRRKTA